MGDKSMPPLDISDSKFFVIDVIDLNDAPTLPLQTIKISEDWNKATLGTLSAGGLY